MAHFALRNLVLRPRTAGIPARVPAGLQRLPAARNGRGYSPNSGPERIALLTDSGGNWSSSNLPNHNILTGVCEGSSTLYLSGRAEWRDKDRLQWTWNGGTNVQR